MRTFTRPAMLAIAFALSLSPAAQAASGGGASVLGATAPVTAAPASGGSSDPIEVQAVKLTRTQTKSVQKRVHVKPDGALGTGTRRAIRKYQSRKALTQTGRPNVQTLRSLGMKLADKLEARLRAAAVATTDPAVQTIPVAGPGDAVNVILAAAREAIGTPYRSGGTTTAGFDCSGLTLWAYAKAGIKLPRTSFDQYGQGTAIDKTAIQPGDLVFFDSAGAGASHVGIATSATTVISATTHGVMEHSIASGYWAGHYLGARRLGPVAVATAASVK